MHESPFPRGQQPSERVFPWVAHYDAEVPARLTYRKVALYAWLDEAARAEPGGVACRFVNRSITYGRLLKDAETIAARLRAAGMRPGERVGVMLPNIPQTVQVFWGILKAGGVVSMINPLYMEKELVHQVNDAGIRRLISIDLCRPKLEALRDKLDIEQYYYTTVAEGLSFPLNLLHRLKTWRENRGKEVPSFRNEGVLPFSSLLEGSERLSVPVEDPENTPAVLQYTGGTTGLSKGVVLTHFNLTANVEQTAAYLFELQQSRQTLLGLLPFFHVYGLTTCLLLPTRLKAAVVPVPRYVPAELLPTLEKYKITAFPGAPSVYISLLQQKRSKKYPLKHLKFCISGSAPMPVEYIRQFESEFNVNFIEGYGLSEASPITHLNPCRGEKRPGSIGLPFPDTEAVIVDMEVGQVELPPGKVGELVISGPQVMREYWNRPDETAGTLRNGKLYTGDIAYMDKDGYFYIVDRKKDMIIVGGYNVAPREIDEVLHEHPKVKEAVTVGVPHPTRGEIIKAYIVPVDGQTLERSEIVAWCRARLANYKVPRQVEFRAELPKTLVGKILRRALRDEEKERSENPASEQAEGELSEMERERRP